MNWDDIRVLTAVARAGSLTEGAKALRVNPTTVTRRLRALEEAAGTALLKKWKHGVILTPAGEDMARVGEEIEEGVHALDARIRGRDARIEGRLRVTTTDLLVRPWLEDFAAFQRANPGIDLELDTSSSLADLTRREADVAVRIAASAPDHLIGRRHAELRFGIYGSEALVERVGAHQPYAAFPFVGFTESGHRGVDNWMAEHAPQAQVVLRVGSLATMMDALSGGLGVSLLPCLTGERTPGLRRIGGWTAGGTWLWVLTHPELRASARVRAFTRFVRGLIERDRALLEGPLD